MPTLYTLSYKPSAEVTEILTFNTETNYVQHERDVKSHTCFGNKNETYKWGKVLEFTDKAQENQFKQAFANKDFTTALGIAQTIEKLYSDTESHPAHHPVRFCLEGYLAQQQKNSIFNKGFFVSQGVCKRREVGFAEQVVAVGSAGVEPS